MFTSETFFFNGVLREKMYCIVNLKNFPYRIRSTKINLAYLLDVKYPKIHNNTGIYEFKENHDLTFTQPCKMNLLLIILEYINPGYPDESFLGPSSMASWSRSWDVSMFGHFIKNT